MTHTKALHHPQFGLLLLRLGLGIVFIYEAYIKLHHMHATIAFFGMIGIGAFWTWVATLTELLGGIAMILGFATQIFGILLAFVMLVAIIKVTGHTGFLGSIETFILGIAALSITFSGPGKYGIEKY